MFIRGYYSENLIFRRGFIKNSLILLKSKHTLMIPLHVVGYLLQANNRLCFILILWCLLARFHRGGITHGFFHCQILVAWHSVIKCALTVLFGIINCLMRAKLLLLVLKIQYLGMSLRFVNELLLLLLLECMSRFGRTPSSIPFHWWNLSYATIISFL